MTRDREAELESQERRRSHREKSPEALKGAGIPFWTKNGVHLVVVERFDFWPGTGKFIDRKTKREGRGVFNLIKIIRQLPT